MARWLVLVLIGAAVNVPLAVSLFRSRTELKPGQTLDLRGPDAAPRGWPASTPHDDPWPSPTYCLLTEAFGYREYSVMAEDPEANAGFSMDAQLYGWPLPVVEQKMMWWDWDDPTLEGPEPDPAPTLLASGVIGNPVIVGTALFVPFVLAPQALTVFRRARRARRGVCPWCGYDAGEFDPCPECGREAIRSAGLPSGTARPPRD